MQGGVIVSTPIALPANQQLNRGNIPMNGGINFDDILPMEIYGNMPMDIGTPFGMNLQDPSFGPANRQLNLEAGIPMDGGMLFGMDLQDPFAVNQLEGSIPIDVGMPIGLELQEPMAKQFMPDMDMPLYGGLTKNGILHNGKGSSLAAEGETGLNRALPGQDVALPAWVTVLLGAFSNFKQDLFSKIDELGHKCGIGCPLADHKSESKDTNNDVGSESEIKSSNHDKNEVSI